MSDGREQFSHQTRQGIYVKYKGLCHLCDRKVHLDDMTVDHINPRKFDGKDSEDNLAAAHDNCNRGRGYLSVEEYRKKQALKNKPLGVYKKTPH